MDSIPLREKREAEKGLKKKEGVLDGRVGRVLRISKEIPGFGLAVAFIIGAASTKLVSAVVNDLVMPIAGALIPGGDWRKATFDVGPIKFLVGDFTGALIDFAIIALVVFVIVKMIMKEEATAKR